MVFSWEVQTMKNMVFPWENPCFWAFASPSQKPCQPSAQAQNVKTWFFPGKIHVLGLLPAPAKNHVTGKKTMSLGKKTMPLGKKTMSKNHVKNHVDFAPFQLASCPAPGPQTQPPQTQPQDPRPSSRPQTPRPSPRPQALDHRP